MNRDFYTRRAEEFAATRGGPWRGWLRLLERLNSCEAPLSVLDVGCGNGRFGSFLRDNLEVPFRYVGIEFSATALEHARENLSGMPAVTLLEHDVTAHLNDRLILPVPNDFSLIVLFGFLHHVPGYETRRALLIDLAGHLSRRGLLVVSVWQFGRFERFRKKIVPWKDFLASTGIPIDPEDLEPGDHILSWGDKDPAYRFCHFSDSEEISRLVASLPLECIEVFSADGHTNDLNRYFVLKRHARESGAAESRPPLVRF
jgi:SAM-dependent methyltransferase